MATGQVTADFDITRWEQEEILTDGSLQIFRVEVGKAFSGGITGTATGWMTMCMAQVGTEPGDSAAYVGFDRLDVELDGRAGSFVVRHDAAMFPGGGDARWDIVPGTGTGELAGVTGIVTIEQDADGHRLSLDYTLPDS